MSHFEFRCNTNIEEIEAKLGSMKKKAPNVLATAVNDTARDAKRLLAKQAKEEYSVASGKFQKAMKLEKAKPAKPVAVIRATGKQMELIDFKTNPKKRIPVEQVQAKVYKSGSLKPLIKKGADHNGKDLKSFIVQYQSGHVTVAQRVPGEETTRTIRGANGRDYRVKADKIRSLPAVAIPQMLKNRKKVYDVVRPMVGEKLQQHINRRVRKVLGT